ncbi:exostosin domain-containing protein [Szabonella alba]|uniref:Exostosin family protein n=1 Tax=Szabonella alba TaxID=2804194 RepID=A0A8K0VBY1_9RHOB|nr:exostosin family protein [Szabonella alba]MBL4919359.1 exostosin family protein [Szabonella alba]
MTPTVYVVTPSFNAAATIDRTIASVLSQAGDFRIRYHVQDGGSTDGTLERIAVWKARLAAGGLPRLCHGIRFSHASEPDRGMYDALVRGFAGLNAASDDFMTWINADDLLMPGALAMAAGFGRQFTAAELSWFGGMVCTLRDDIPNHCFDRPAPREALRLGLCDGVHWPFLQQEGTFFRKWLWSATDPEQNVASLRLAGDWNLWRLMAEKASLAQVTVPLGARRLSAGPMAPLPCDGYKAELDGILDPVLRRADFESFCAAGPVLRRRIRTGEGDSFKIVEECVDDFAQKRHLSISTDALWRDRAQPDEREVANSKAIACSPVDPQGASPVIAGHVQRQPGLIALDLDWQFPAITEQHAFRRLAAGQGRGQGGQYIAYPWATLIDKIQKNTPDADLHLDRFEQFCALLPEGGRKITVCQHIHGRKLTDLFRQAGITDVFWSHATPEDAAASAAGAGEDDLRIHPFPLYPVQVPAALPEAGPDADATPRPYLFSFIGARANQYYLTEARNWILDLLKDDPRGLILGRDSWHYQKVVYELQIKGAATQDDAPALVDVSASDQFRASLLQSTFSLCPAGSGPNSIRLWESLGAGAIPVILADSWAPPGDRRLWDMAAVFCRETPEDIRALPDRLAALAADPVRLAQMRHAMRQLWLLYGPDAFVTDIEALLLDETGTPGLPVTSGPGGAGDALADALARQDGAGLLQASAGALLLDPAAMLARLAADAMLARALDAALEKAGSGTGSAPLAAHYDAVLAHARRKVPAAVADTPVPAIPALQRGAVPKICLFGKHANRTPLSYAPIRRLIGDRLQEVDNPAAADLVIAGFNIDLRDAIETLHPLLGAGPGPKVPPKFAVISEEPLWDITWSGPFTGSAGRISARGLEIPYAFLGHETSAVYDFRRIPYFVLTANSYAIRYASLMARFATLSPAALVERWNRAPVRAAFFAEYRKGETFARSWPERDVAGLSSYRTEVAEAMTGRGVLRMGKGWGEAGPRQALPDWHLDKLAHLDGRTRMLAAFENVHQRHYISEKIFDAFAIGAVPVYWAGPQHRIFDLVPAGALLNCHGFGSPAAATQIAEFTPDTAFAEAWLATCSRLAALFGDRQVIQEERRRVSDALLQAVEALV